MMRRTQHRGQRTVWSEVPHRVAPRFRVDSTVMLDSAPPAQLDDEPYKLSLALLGLQFITPWITVADGSGRHLEQLELRLTASGDSLAGVRWEGHYVDNTGGEFAPPAHIALRVVWEVADELDFSTALSLLLLLAAALAAALLCTLCAREGGALEEAALQYGDERPPPHEGRGVDEPYGCGGESESERERAELHADGYRYVDRFNDEFAPRDRSKWD